MQGPGETPTGKERREAAIPPDVGKDLTKGIAGNLSVALHFAKLSVQEVVERDYTFLYGYAARLSNFV